MSERGFLRRYWVNGGAERRYVVYVPDTYDPVELTPALLFLHGRGEEGTDGWAQVAVGLGPAIMLAPDRWPFIAVFPQKPRDPHGWVEHASLALGALAQTRDEWAVDPARIYLTGVSLGGFGSWLLGARRRDLFAAIAPVCGGGDPADAPELAGLPTWAFHGEADPVVPPRHSESMVEAVRAAGGDPKLTLYPGIGHNSWDRAYQEERVAEWLLEQRI